jgi:pyruvate dehydrogenase phosphatase
MALILVFPPALGDFAFKLPSDFIRKVMLNIEPGFQTQRHTEELISRIHSPPYISNKAEVYHRAIKPSDKYLILSSDGLSDLYPQDPFACTDWVQSIATNESLEKNKALRILRNALGGSEEDVVSRHLTVEMEGRWMDDTTILVLDLWGSGRDVWEND